MKKIKGYFSIIQYCPDLSRFEAANVGVILFCPEINYLQAKTARGNQRIAKFFGQDGHDWKRINSLKKGIEEQLLSEHKHKYIQKVADLSKFALMRANSIQLTRPLPIKVDDPVETLERLFIQKVGGAALKEDLRVATTQTVGLKKRLESEFIEAGLDDKILSNVKIPIPSLEKEIDVPFGYKNGRFNLITPVRFRAADVRTNQKTAYEYAFEGRSIYGHPHKDLGKMQLVVVGEFRDDDIGTSRRTIERIFEESDVKFFESEEIPRLVKEIRKDGKDISNLRLGHQRTLRLAGDIS